MSLLLLRCLRWFHQFLSGRALSNSNLYVVACFSTRFLNFFSIDQQQIAKTHYFFVPYARNFDCFPWWTITWNPNFSDWSALVDYLPWRLTMTITGCIIRHVGIYFIQYWLTSSAQGDSIGCLFKTLHVESVEISGED